MGNVREKRLAFEAERGRYNFIRMWQRRYSHMKARHDGLSTNSSRAKGKGICTQEEFFAWCKDFANFSEFLTLYFEWASADFPLHLTPSIDRIDSERGYVLGNLQWLSFADNCAKNDINPIDHSKGGWYA